MGFGDADPSNVSPLVHGAEMRVAETRAVNRALRKEYGIGICSVEEIGSVAEPRSSRDLQKLPPQPANGNNSGPKVRDRLCQIMLFTRVCYSLTWTGTSSGIHREFSRALTTSAAVNLPITSARLRLRVVWRGFDRSAARIPRGEYHEPLSPQILCSSWSPVLPGSSAEKESLHR